MPSGLEDFANILRRAAAVITAMREAARNKDALTVKLDHVAAELASDLMSIAENLSRHDREADDEDDVGMSH